MFRSIRSRLWLSYAALIVAALAVVAVVLLLFLIRNPLLYRQAFARLTAAQTLLASQQVHTQRMQEVAAAFNVRVLIYAPDGRLAADSSSSQATLLLAPR